MAHSLPSFSEMVVLLFDFSVACISKIDRHQKVVCVSLCVLNESGILQEEKAFNYFEVEWGKLIQFFVI